MAVLREVRYLKFMGTADIPEDAIRLFAEHDTFRMYVANLDLTVNWYNSVRNNVLDVEYPLIEQQLSDIDAVLNEAETDLSWNGESKYIIVYLANNVLLCGLWLLLLIIRNLGIHSKSSRSCSRSSNSNAKCKE